ncbi:MAG: hypothetical protein ABL930_08830 [Pseudobdellovibrio sp.]
MAIDKSWLTGILSEEQIDYLTKSFLKAYAVAQSKYDEVDGDCSTTFGLCLHYYARKQLKDIFKDVEVGDIDFEDGRSFSMKIRDKKLAFYKVGYNKEQDIKNCFPQNSKTAPRMAEENRSLDLFDMETGETLFDSLLNQMKKPAPSNVKNWVIAHLGNPETGLEAIYLCAPISVDNEKISEWMYSIELYRRSADASLDLPENENKVVHPIVETPDFKVARKHKKSVMKENDK